MFYCVYGWVFGVCVFEVGVCVEVVGGVVEVVEFEVGGEVDWGGVGCCCFLVFCCVDGVGGEVGGVDGYVEFFGWLGE